MRKEANASPLPAPPPATPLFEVASGVELVEAVGGQRLADVHELLLEIPSETQLMPSQDFVERGAEIVVRDRELEDSIRGSAQSAYSTAAEPLRMSRRR